MAEPGPALPRRARAAEGRAAARRRAAVFRCHAAGGGLGYVGNGGGSEAIKSGRAAHVLVLTKGDKLSSVESARAVEALTAVAAGVYGGASPSVVLTAARRAAAGRAVGRVAGRAFWVGVSCDLGCFC